MVARKKTGPAPLPVRDVTNRRPVVPVRAAHVALVLAASTLLACGASTGSLTFVEPKECPRLGGAPPMVTPPTSATAPLPSSTPVSVPSSSATTASIPPNTPSILPVDPPMLGGAPPMYVPPTPRDAPAIGM